jgi:transposase
VSFAAPGLASGGFFRNMTGMSLEITEALIARQSPEAQAIIRALLAKIQQLQDQLNQSPRNSSVPPSTEHPHAKPPRPQSRAARQRGGQPGHPKHGRPLLPPEQCDDIIPLKPTSCRRCGRGLSGEDAAPLRHQVWELPEIKPLVIEYQRHRLACTCCGETTCAALPPGVPTGQSGPRLVAFAGLLIAYFRQSKRRTALFLGTLLNQPCCPALTLKMQAQVTQALRPAYEELAGALPAQPRLGIDESPTKEAATKAWLWTFVAGLLTVFAVRGTRAATVLTELLTERFAGVVICDRAKMYWALGGGCRGVGPIWRETSRRWPTARTASSGAWAATCCGRRASCSGSGRAAATGRSAGPS